MRIGTAAPEPLPESKADAGLIQPSVARLVRCGSRRHRVSSRRGRCGARIKRRGPGCNRCVCRLHHRGPQHAGLKHRPVHRQDHHRRKQQTGQQAELDIRAAAQKLSQLHRCSVIGITSSSTVVSNTSRRLNGRLNSRQSVVPRHHRLQMVPNAPSHHSPASPASSNPASSNHGLSLTHSAWHVEPSRRIAVDRGGHNINWPSSRKWTKNSAMQTNEDVLRRF